MSTGERVTIGGATLIHGDCRDHIVALSGCDVVIADPPYGIPIKFGTQKKSDGGTRTMQFGWDDKTSALSVFDICRQLGPYAENHFWFCGLHQVSRIADILLEYGMVPKAACWLKKYPPPAGFGTKWPSAFENAVFGYRPSAYFSDSKANRRNVFEYDSYRHGQPGKVDHPTQKPLALINYLVNTLCRPDGAIADPYMGSGTTGVSAILLDRKYVGVEIDRDYFDLACRRIADAARQSTLPLTGGSAVA